jgi:hypothetical protein
MPTPIDRQEVQRLLVEEQARLVAALPAAEYEDEHRYAEFVVDVRRRSVETRGKGSKH